MHARVPQVMAQFVLKIELLSHIMGTTPILEMARAYGLRPRLWLLALHENSKKTSFFQFGRFFIIRASYEGIIFYNLVVDVCERGSFFCENGVQKGKGLDLGAERP